MLANNVVKDYLPWSAEFIDGSLISRLDDPNALFSEIIPKLPLLYTFSIHLDWDRLFSVRVTDAKFYVGTRPGDTRGWFDGPVAINSPVSLIYYRKCVGCFDGPKFISAVQAYVLGWKKDGLECKMSISPSGEYVWL